MSPNASETQTDTTLTFTELVESIEQNEEFQESRVHYTPAGIKGGGAAEVAAAAAEFVSE